MAEIKINLRQLKEEKETPIILRVYYNGFEIKCKTKKKCLPSLWDNELGRPDKTAKGLKDLSKRLDYLKVCAQETDNYFENVLKRIATPKEFQEYFYILSGIEKVEVPEVEKKTLISFMSDLIEEDLPNRLNDDTNKPLSPNTIKCYKQTLKLIKEYNAKVEKIDFNTIDLVFLRKFKKYMRTTRKYQQNTMSKHVKTLKAVLNEATSEKVNNNLIYLHKKFKVSPVEIEAIYLNQKELTALFNLDLSRDLKLERVRDLFLVGCYTGLRFSDFSNIQPENIGEEFITVLTKKTNEEVVIPIHANVRAILSKYEGQYYNSLPPSISNQKMNQYLKEIGQEVECLTEKISITIKKENVDLITWVHKFEKLTTHTARRSFATNLFKEKFPVHVIMKITGHRTEKAFLKYVRATSKEYAEILKMHWERNAIMKVV